MASDGGSDGRALELVGIQYLRGIAAMMVLVFHLRVQLDRMGYAGAWPEGLFGGVDLFYVISGVIMWVTTADRPGDTPIAFWRRRALRIVPLYWAVTGFVTVVMLVAPQLMQSGRFDASHVAASFLFIAWPHPVSGHVEPVVIPGWTLNHEMLFYLLFGLALLLPRQARLWGMIALLCGLVGLGRWLLPPLSVNAAAFYTSGMLLEFGFGMMIGALAMHGGGLARLPVGWACALIGLGVAGLALLAEYPTIPRLAGQGIPAALLVAGVLAMEAHRRLGRSPALHAIGNASYSIYLSHMISLSAGSQLWRAVGLPVAGGWLALYGILAVTMSVAAGGLLYRFVEHPLGRRLRPDRDAMMRGS